MSDICPECSADVSEFDASCRNCGEEWVGYRGKLRPKSETVTGHHDSRKGHKPHGKELSQIGLRSLLIMVAVVACLLGLFRLAFWVGALATVFAAPVAIRWAVLTSREHAAGKGLQLFDHASNATGSFGLMFVLAMTYGMSWIAAGFAIAVPSILAGELARNLITTQTGMAVSFLICMALCVSLQLLFSIGFLYQLFHADPEINQNHFGDIGFYSVWVNVATVVISLAVVWVNYKVEPYFAWQVPQLASISIVAALFGLITSGMALWRRPRLLACVGFGLILGHLPAVIAMMIFASLASSSNITDDSSQHLPLLLCTIYAAGLLLGALMAAGLFAVLNQRDANTEEQANQNGSIASTAR